jgi:hypothetical protein
MSTFKSGSSVPLLCLFLPFSQPLLLLPCSDTNIGSALGLVVLPLPLPPRKLPRVEAVVILCLAGGMLSLAAATKTFSGNGYLLTVGLQFTYKI